MKKSLLLISTFIISYTVLAQYPLPKGSVQFNSGLVFANSNKPFYLGVDYALKTDLTLGGEIIFFEHRTGIVGNLNYQFNELLHLPKKLNIYSGVNSLIFIANSSNDKTGEDNLIFSGQLGGRYKLSSSVSINIEFGLGNSVSNGKLGITARL